MNLNIDKSHWKKVQFGDVVQKLRNVIDPETYHSEIVIQGGHIKKRDFHIREYENKNDLGYLGPAFNMGFKKSQILYVSRNPHLMKVGYPDFDGICANTTFVLETKDESILRNDLIPFIMHSDNFIEQSVANVRGGVNPYVNWSDLASISFLLPPKGQQAELAELLWAMDFEVESKISLMNSTSAFVESKLKALLMGEVQTARRETKLGPINADWECHTLETLIKREIISSHLDGNHGSYYPRSEEFVDDGVPYISANCISENEISFANAKYLTEDRAATIKKGIALNGDILLAHNATVGPVAKLQTKLEKVILGTSLTYYRVNENKMNRDFLFYFMKSRLFQAQLEKVMNQSTRNQVPITTQRSLLFIVPPISTQNLLVTELNRIDDLRKELKMMVRKSKSLQRSIINQIF